jgi:hypothetical protein
LIHSLDAIFIRNVIKKSIVDYKIPILTIHDCVIFSNLKENKIDVIKIIIDRYKEMYNNKDIIKILIKNLMPERLDKEVIKK